MSHDGSIRADHLWKRFRSDRSRALLRDELERLRARMNGNGDTGWRWALRDISFAVSPGESIGLVGANGSGKSTLLKILTRVMYPHSGGVDVSGRVGALIEVRAGIHPDLSGRENVYLYGSLLGLNRREVAARFDDIVGFAEVGSAIDRQVKFYSSGMQMRLGFAVAAFLDPHILLVDEVLAVGDASFQQRCLDRMRDVLVDGTTLVFVSHDLAAVEAACRRGIWLRDGVTVADGPIREVLGSYRRAVERRIEGSVAPEGPVRLLKCQVDVRSPFDAGDHSALHLTLRLESQHAWHGDVHVGVSEGTASPVFVVGRSSALSSGETEIRCELANVPLPRGRYFVWVGGTEADGREALSWHPAAHVDVMGPALDPVPVGVVRPAPVHVTARWDVRTP